MASAALPPDEAQRLQTLYRYDVLDTAPEQAFDDLTHLAAYICGAPIALISLVGAERQWFKSKVGFEASETPRGQAFCGYGILEQDIFIVPDASQDARFASNPFVTGPDHIRFYAGAPLRSPDGHTVGMICVKDTIPRNLSPEQADALRALGRQAMVLLEFRQHMAELTKQAAARQEAEAERERLQNEIIRYQAQKLAELSIPVIPVSDQVLAMPLIGSVDFLRAQQVLETLLDGITKHHAKIVILDITGVPVIDTQIAESLMRAARAARLLGAEVILTGIRPEVAQTLVSIGVDLTHTITRSTLQSGIAYAIQRAK